MTSADAVLAASLKWPSPLRGAEQVSPGAGVHQEPLVGGRAQGATQVGKPADELRHGKLELADQDSTESIAVEAVLAS
jgi:hypothetical protein